MKWLLSAIAVIACLVLADEAKAGNGFVQQRVFVQQSNPHCFGNQAFIQRQRVFVPSFRQQRQVLVVPQRQFGFQRQNVFVQQQPLFQFRLNLDD